MHQYLRIDKASPNNPNPQPKLKIFSTCTGLIKEIPEARHDEHRPEDLDTDQPDHALDDCRYFLRTLREFKTEKEENAVQRRIRILNDSNAVPLFPS
jgi:hypothetical protein